MGRYWRMFLDSLNGPYRGIWLVIAAMHVMMLVIMPILNWLGLTLLIGVLGTITFLVLCFLGFMPQVLVISTGFGATIQSLRDKDVSQGAVKGLVTVYRVITATVMAFLASTVVLMLFQFEFGGFIGVYIGAMLIFTTYQVWSMPTKWGPRIMVGLGAAIIVMTLVQPYSDLLNGRAYDGDGHALHMKDPVTNAYDPLERTWKDCAPKGKEYDEIDWATESTCHSVDTDNYLIPATGEDAEWRSLRRMAPRAASQVSTWAGSALTWATTWGDDDEETVRKQPTEDDCNPGFAHRIRCTKVTIPDGAMYPAKQYGSKCWIWDAVDRTRNPLISYEKVGADLELTAGDDEEVHLFLIERGETYEYHPDSLREDYPCPAPS